MHFFTIVLVPESTQLQDLEETIDRLIAPYDENKDVEPYLDGDGEESTYNPQSKWDWWRIGGRYDGVVQEKERDSEDGGFNFSPGHEYVEHNILHVKQIDHKVHCVAIVTPDGQWHDRKLFEIDPEKLLEWDEKLVQIIQNNRNCLMVGIDCHI